MSFKLGPLQKKEHLKPLSQGPELSESRDKRAEIMPVGQFPGERNWEYDVAYPFAVQNSYCGPESFKRLIDSCHTL